MWSPGQDARVCLGSGCGCSGRVHFPSHWGPGLRVPAPSMCGLDLGVSFSELKVQGSARRVGPPAAAPEVPPTRSRPLPPMRRRRTTQDTGTQQPWASPPTPPCPQAGREPGSRACVQESASSSGPATQRPPSESCR